VLIVGGLVFGLVFGRWWALLVPAGLALWIGLTEEVEVSGWYLGFAYAAVSGLGVVLGIALRRLVFAPGHRPGR
jgi:hypothetical protein